VEGREGDSGAEEITIRERAEAWMNKIDVRHRATFGNN